MILKSGLGDAPETRLFRVFDLGASSSLSVSCFALDFLLSSLHPIICIGGGGNAS